jgi:hypothetical protein
VSLWAGSGSPGPFGTARNDPGHLAAVERVKDWTRGRFALGEDDTILVTESSPMLPGYPKRETVVCFWSEGTRHHYKVFRPVEEIVADDVPPAWLKNSLALSPGIECACC